jgi:glucose-6-phosphate isomerase
MADLMSIKQTIDSALEKTIGPHGVSEAALSGALARAEGALDRLRRHHTEGTLPLLRLPEKTDDLAEITAAARRLAAGASDIVILGTGGSSLGGQTIAQLAGFNVPGVGIFRDPPRMHFIDNLDALSFATMLARLPLATSRFVAISKSGGTAETLMQTIAAMSALKAAGADLPNAMLGISEPAKAGKRNGLRDLLTQHGIALLDHDPNVGGRYSALTNVGLLPAAALGLDIGAIRKGAASALAPVLAG